MRFLACVSIVAALAAAPAAAQETQSQSPDDPPWSQADAYFDAEEMRKSREALLRGHGASNHSFVIVDRLELQAGGGEENILWDAQAWTGGDIDKLWIKTEGEYSFSDNEFEEAEVQALWSHAIAPFFDLQAGLRVDLEPDERTHLVVGVQGLAPYWFEVDVAAFLSDGGDFTARIEAEYDLRINQRLIAQPRVEANISAQNIPEIGVGTGLTNIEAGLRLHYEIKPEFAPYIGVEWQRDIGGTARFTRASGGDADRIAAVAGIRFWF